MKIDPITALCILAIVASVVFVVYELILQRRRESAGLYTPKRLLRHRRRYRDEHEDGSC